MKRYFAIWRHLIKNCVVRETEFSVNFLLQLFSNFLWFIFSIFFFNVIYHHVRVINGWTSYQVYFLIATNQIIIYLYEAFFAKNLNRFPILIKYGELDHFIIKPIDAQFMISVRYFDIKPILSLPIPIYILVFSLRHMTLNVSFLNFSLYLLLILLGVTLRYVLGFSIMLLSFIFVEISALHALQSEFLKYASYPAGIFNNLSYMVFTFIIPIVLIANLPAASILQTVKNYRILTMFAVFYGISFFYISRRIFYYCLRNYSSASS